MPKRNKPGKPAASPRSTKPKSPETKPRPEGMKPSPPILTSKAGAKIEKNVKAQKKSPSLFLKKKRSMGKGGREQK